MKSKQKNFAGISIDHVLIALLVALLISMIVRAHSQANAEQETGLHVFDSYAKAAL
ncbi:hypothetical protein [Luteolibacter soli]|uniref:Uncharacterized protein n=1 Tax=Luteolibacter soli TaxID=3135280 RepID=A0ABU9AZ66_9BACT